MPLIIIIVAIAIAVPVVIAVIGLLAAIAIPNFVKARNSAQKNACVLNLKSINSAKMSWKVEHNKRGTDEPTDADLFGTQKYMQVKPVCPADGIYIIGPVDQKPACTVAGHQL